jgi:glycosyltransferase involved in cell wall biosynthesis
LPGSAGGIETNLLALLRALAALDESGEQVVIGPGGESEWLRPHLGPRQSILAWPPIRYTPDGKRDRPADRIRAAVRAWRTRTARTPAVLWRALHDQRSSEGERITRALIDRGVRLVHFPYQRHFPTSLPSIFEPWDLQHRHHPEFFTPDEIALREHIYGTGCAAASIVVTASEWSKRDLVRQFDLDPDKITVIPRGVVIPPPPCRAEATSTIAALGLSDRFALYPAKAWPHKNHLRLFEALALLRDRRGIVVPLVCTGKPVDDHWPRIHEGLRRWGLERSVRFTGQVSAEVMSALYVCAELLVFPSLFEGLGIPLLEAMHHGLPIASSTATCLAEVGGDAAVYFDPESSDSIAEGIHRLWQDRDLQAACRAAGTVRLTRFDWGTAARQFQGCYTQLARTTGKDRG